MEIYMAPICQIFPLSLVTQAKANADSLIAVSRINIHYQITHVMLHQKSYSFVYM